MPLALLPELTNHWTVMKTFLHLRKHLESPREFPYIPYMRIIFFIISFIGYSYASADCISDALASANVDRSMSQITTTPVPSDGTGNVKYQISVFGPLAGGAIVICSPDDKLVGFEAPFQFIGSN